MLPPIQNSCVGYRCINRIEGYGESLKSGGKNGPHFYIRRRIMNTLLEKATAFRSLHERDRAFIIPNPWDVGTARIIAHLGFEALATTSAGYAFSIGQRDNTVGREQMLEHVRTIAAAT